MKEWLHRALISTSSGLSGVRIGGRSVIGSPTCSQNKTDVIYHFKNCGISSVWVLFYFLRETEIGGNRLWRYHGANRAPLTHHSVLYSRVSWTSLCVRRLSPWYVFISKTILGLIPSYLSCLLTRRHGGLWSLVPPPQSTNWTGQGSI